MLAEVLRKVTVKEGQINLKNGAEFIIFPFTDPNCPAGSEKMLATHPQVQTRFQITYIVTQRVFTIW